MPEAYAPAVVWDNSRRPYDAGIFGRYAALAEVRTPLAYFQDDDCVVPGWVHRRLWQEFGKLTDAGVEHPVVGNVLLGRQGLADQRAAYDGTTLLGWGAAFRTASPWRAFELWAEVAPLSELVEGIGYMADIAFPMLSDPYQVEGNVQWLFEGSVPVFQRENRVWKQEGFWDQTLALLARARYVREELERRGIVDNRAVL